MKKRSIQEQLSNNLIAIISLIVALVALSYTTWREERTERNRNTRQAAFEVLTNLGQLQLAVNFAHYQPENTMGNPIIAWGYIAIISDMSRLLAPPVPETVDRLLNVWNSDWDKVKTSEESVDKISEQIDASRRVVVKQLEHLR